MSYIVDASRSMLPKKRSVNLFAFVFRSLICLMHIRDHNYDPVLRRLNMIIAGKQETDCRHFYLV